MLDVGDLEAGADFYPASTLKEFYNVGSLCGEELVDFQGYFGVGAGHFKVMFCTSYQRVHSSDVAGKFYDIVSEEW